jgi:hypothetical protein
VALGFDAGAAPAARPVPSLQPKVTARLWQQLVRRPRALAVQQGTTDCRPLRAVFYTATDWLRLATKLAGADAPCVEYYISIPPLAADKTQFRVAQPASIHALGPNFHVLAEISTHGWANWVAADSSRTWYQAGQEARRRMAAANFDVTQGDSWIVNEFSSAVVRGIGVARANMRQLVHGLHDGDGGPPVKGGVFTMLMLGVVTSSFPTYKAYVQDWYTDTPFWNDMAAYVSDWSQELYGDIRNYAVAGSSLLDRRAALDDFLQHELKLASTGPAEIEAARAFLRSAYSPLANAAWRYDSGFGWTAVPYEQMEDYVSAQTYALRSFAARNGETLDHFGFAWAPKSPAGMSSSDFTAQSGAIADRLAAAIRDSSQSADPTDPGLGACAPAGENVWCTTTLAGAAFEPAWQTFTSWSPDALALLGGGTATAGQPTPLTAELQVAGIAWPEATPVTVTLASSSASGEFAPSADGPWAPTFELSVPAGSTDAAFYYRDTSAGSVTLTASAPERVGAMLTVTVGAAALAALEISPTNVTVTSGGSQQFTASGADAYGNPLAPSPAWSVGSGTPGTISASGLFVADPNTAGSGAIIAAASGVTATASVVVAAPDRLKQTIGFAPLAARTYGDPDFTVDAAASSGLPVTLSANGNCTTGGATIHLTGAGSCTVTASQAGNASYNPAPDVSQAFAIAKANQTISFAPLADKTFGDPDFTLGASASSGREVSFTASGDCTLSGAKIHLTGAGSCTVTATQPGDSNYNAAPDVPQTIAIARATPLKPTSKCVVPKVVGKPLGTAKRMLARRHCRPGRIRYVGSRKTKKGLVIAQNRRPGRVLPANTKIALSIGGGPGR